MTEERSEAETELEREIREARKFTPQEAMARMAGPGAMKGASPVSPVQQAETEIGSWLRSHVADTSGVLASDYLLKELVREADVEWGQRMDERPYFEKEGSTPHPNDPYTVESVRTALSDIMKRLADTTG